MAGARLQYVYAVTFNGWGLDKIRNGEVVGAITRLAKKPGYESATLEAREHAARAIATAKRFGRPEPEIIGL